MDIALLNADKNNKTTYLDHKNAKNQQTFHLYLKKDPKLPNKIFKGTRAQINRFEIAIVIFDHNPSIEIIFAEDHQIDEIHKIVHKIDIADHYN